MVSDCDELQDCFETGTQDLDPMTNSLVSAYGAHGGGTNRCLPLSLAVGRVKMLLKEF